MLYVPIMKFKQGEKDALYQLPTELKEKVMPLFEITPDVIQKEKSLGISQIWELPYFFDISPEYYSELSDEEYLGLLEKCQGGVVPIIKLTDNSERVETIIARVQNGVAIRIYLDEILDDNFPKLFSDLTHKLNLSETDLIIDVRFVESGEINIKSTLTKEALNRINNISEFRTTIVASNSFPQNLSTYDKHSLVIIPRNESKFYNKVKQHFEEKGIKIVYSDYGVNHWTYFEYVPGMQVTFNIRYTYYDNFVIYRGDSIKRGGFNFAKVQEACNALINSSYFLGQNFSWADQEIYDKAHGVVNKPGNPTTWRALGTNHHIVFILNYLSNQL
ncbi:beta family protein [Parageobacillus toebii]|uniref:beta family protein n=1 Tax=Parageobacillus toebii TaxID=153151 RepID=UPI00281686C5|nr:beta family protein [Parageobacillus toebii]WMT19185.1 beta family protein [Parageobacillus toebii]